MKVSMELTGVFYGWELSAGVMPAVSSTSHVPITGHILGIFSMTNTPAEAELAGEVERDSFVCVWAFCF